MLTLQNFTPENESRLKHFLEQSIEAVEYLALSGKNDFLINKLISQFCI